MKRTICYLCFVISIMSCTTNEMVSLFVGTYTNGKSEGIYQLQFNQETGKFSTMQLAAKVKNPSFLTFSPDKKYLYAVSETNDYNGTESGSVSAYKVQANGQLQFINKESSQGAHPCHISTNSTGKMAVISNYSGGTVAIFDISENGSISEARQVFNHNSENETSHAHSAQFFKDRLYVSDLGRNSVYEYQRIQNNYTLVKPSIIPMIDKAGPRHFALSKKGDFIYIINEYTNTITAGFKSNSAFELLAHTTTLDETFKGESFCADIHLSENEKFLYGTNRGENSIVVFKRNLTRGDLQKIQTIGVEGDWPRNFTLSPNEKYLLVANQKSENISVYSINKSTGKLTFLHSEEFPSPVCLLF